MKRVHLEVPGRECRQEVEEGQHSDHQCGENEQGPLAAVSVHLTTDIPVGRYLLRQARIEPGRGTVVTMIRRTAIIQ